MWPTGPARHNECCMTCPTLADSQKYAPGSNPGYTKPTLLFLLLLFGPLLLSAQDSLRVSSRYLNTDIMVYIWKAPGRGADERHIYATDGLKLIEAGALKKIQELSKAGLIPAATYIMVSSRDPNSGRDLRNVQFFCNPDYLSFFEQELIPAVERRLAAKASPARRALMGISFGGLNAAYFTAKSSSFQNYALVSPITYPCPKLTEHIAFGPNKDLRIWLSTGTNDAEVYVSQLQPLYASKGFTLKQIQTSGAHDFDNWNQLWPAMINFLLNRL